MRLVKLPTIRTKHLDTMAHAVLSSLHALLRRYDVALYFNVGVSAVAWLPRLVGQRVVLNVDGLDWKRRKWKAFARRYLRVSERLATRVPDAIVTDSRRVQAYYRERYGADSVYIAYGADPIAVPPGPTLRRFGLEPERYVLFVGRLVPENCAHHLVEAFRGLATDLRCVVVGDAPYAADYIRGLRACDDGRVVFTGYVFGDGYRELLSSAYAFVETSEVGGTHPALLEAMAAGRPVVVNDTPENLETIGEDGLGYDGEVGGASLRTVLAGLLVDPARARAYGERALARVRALYSWDGVTDAYERLFAALCEGARAPRAL
jgi:glycosyltransferase involved in cell wall biosynthesis